MTDLEVMIILIEGEYPREQRNTTEKIQALIKLEFSLDVNIINILKFYGFNDDYKKESKIIEHGYNQDRFKRNTTQRT